jgi:hypothetical protein
MTHIAQFGKPLCSACLAGFCLFGGTVAGFFLPLFLYTIPVMDPENWARGRVAQPRGDLAAQSRGGTGLPVRKCEFTRLSSSSFTASAASRIHGSKPELQRCVGFAGRVGGNWVRIKTGPHERRLHLLALQLPIREKGGA